jgi:hypothetical protein
MKYLNKPLCPQSKITKKRLKNPHNKFLMYKY